MLLVKKDDGTFDLTYAKSKSKHFCKVRFCTNPSPRSVTGNPKDGFVCARCKRQRWRANNPEKAAFANLRDHAKGRKIPFRLTFAEFLEFCKNNGYIEGKGRKADALSVDRIDATKGYSIDNIQILTCSENSEKSGEERKTGNYYQGQDDDDYYPDCEEELDLTSPVFPDTDQGDDDDLPF